MAITPGGPYNIPPGGPEGSSGHIQWSTDVADSVNDLHIRASKGSGFEPGIVSNYVRTGLPHGPEYWASLNAGDLTAYPVYYGEPFAIDGMSCNPRGGITDSELTMIFYSPRTDFFSPGVVLKTATVAASSSGWKAATFTATDEFLPGWYWHGILRLGGSGVQDVHGSPGYQAPLDVVGSGTVGLETAVRFGSWTYLTASGVSTPSDNPTMIHSRSHAPVVGVRFA